MAAATKPTVSSGLARLRDPFAENEMGHLPRVIDKATQKAQCRQGTNASADGIYCGGYHQRSIHLTYVGHAAITKRLLEVDENWEWNPMGFDSDGLPAFDRNGGLWITLTVLGQTKIGYGDAEGKSGPAAVKEAIGDALRNAGMRFGMALDLWHKGDLYANEVEQGKLEADAEEAPKAPATGAKVKKANNFVADAQSKTNADEVLEVWRNAKRGGASAEELAEINAIGTKLREAEEVKKAVAIDPASDPVIDPEYEAAEKMQGAFGG